jgi:tetratricopeptide (TPR) repeat protein
MKRIFNFIFLLFLLIIICNVSYSQSSGDLVWKAKDYYDNGVYSQAKEYAKKVIEAGPNLEAHKIYVKSCKHLSEKDTKEIGQCIEYYETKCSKMWFYDKNKPVFLFGLGFAYLQGGRYKEAKEAFNTSIKLDPRAPYIKDIQKSAKKDEIALMDIQDWLWGKGVTAKMQDNLKLDEIPTRSMGDDIQLGTIGVISILVLAILGGVYATYKERKSGEQQVAKIKKDRSINFFGKRKQ